MHILQYSMGGNPIPAIYGGAVQQTIEELSRSLVEKNQEVTVITNVNNAMRKELEEIDKQGVNYQYVYTDKFSSFSYFTLLPQVVKKIIENGPYDVVHIHVPVWIDVLNLIRKKIGNPKIIWHVHNRSRFSRLAERPYVDVVGISESVLNGIGRSKNEENVAIIPNICRYENFPVLNYNAVNEIKKKYGIDKEEYVIGFAGRISSEKGLDVLLDAIAKLKRNNITLLIAGSSWFKDAKKTEYEKKVFEKSKSLNVKWLGYVDNWLLHEIYNISDIFTVPSVWEEPAGQVVIEAQSCGTKVIASNIGGIPEFLSPYETTFEAGNAEDLSRKIQKEMDENNSEDFEVKNKRHNWVKERYNIDVISNMWIEHYKK